MPRVVDKRTNVFKGPWTDEEDATQLKLLDGLTHLPRNKLWVDVGARMTERNGTQCRERWLNHLNPDVKKGAHPCHKHAAGKTLRRAAGADCNGIAQEPGVTRKN